MGAPWERVITLGERVAKEVISPAIINEMQRSIQLLDMIQQYARPLPAIGDDRKKYAEEKDTSWVRATTDEIKYRLGEITPLYAKRQALNEKIATALIVSLGLKNYRALPVKVSVNHPASKVVTPAVQDFIQLTGGGAGGSIKIQKADDKEGFGRSFYNEDTHTIHLRDNPGIPTIWHELGHWLEHMLPGAIGAARGFYKHKTTGNPSIPLNKLIPDKPGHREGETGKRGQFVDPYVGKDYKVGSTEITSMGMQFLAEDPARLYMQARDHFYFLLGIITAAQNGVLPWA